MLIGRCTTRHTRWCALRGPGLACRLGTSFGSSRCSRLSPLYAASANGLWSIQSKEKSGSSCRGCGAIRFADVALSFMMESWNSASFSFSASVDGTHGGR